MKVDEFLKQHQKRFEMARAVREMENLGYDPEVEILIADIADQLENIHRLLKSREEGILEVCKQRNERDIEIQRLKEQVKWIPLPPKDYPIGKGKTLRIFPPEEGKIEVRSENGEMLTRISLPEHSTICASHPGSESND